MKKARNAPSQTPEGRGVLPRRALRDWSW